MKAAFDLAQKLVRANDAQEALPLQTDFVKAQVGPFKSRQANSTLQSKRR